LSFGLGSIAQYARDFVVGEGRKWSVIALKNTASRHGFADDPSRNAAFFEQPARVRRAIGWKRRQQRTRRKRTPGIGAQSVADRPAGFEPEYRRFIQPDLDSGGVGEFVETR
jgi:hypothetical protein